MINFNKNNQNGIDMNCYKVIDDNKEKSFSINKEMIGPNKELNNQTDNDDGDELTNLSWLISDIKQQFNQINNNKFVNYNSNGIDSLLNNQNSTQSNGEIGEENQKFCENGEQMTISDSAKSNKNLIENMNIIDDDDDDDDDDLLLLKRGFKSLINYSKKNKDVNRSIEKTNGKKKDLVQSNLAHSKANQINMTRERFNKFIEQIKRCRESYEQKRDIYLSNFNEKPPFNYAQIIGMAMLEIDSKVTLQQICKWIKEKFIYYQRHTNWNNSIRHNLSLHYGFTKIPRDKNEKGKGGYWKLSINTKKSLKKRVRHRKYNSMKMQKKSGHRCEEPKSVQPIQEENEIFTDQNLMDATVYNDQELLTNLNEYMVNKDNDQIIVEDSIIIKDSEVFLTSLENLETNGNYDSFEQQIITSQLADNSNANIMLNEQFSDHTEPIIITNDNLIDDDMINKYLLSVTEQEKHGCFHLTTEYSPNVVVDLMPYQMSHYIDSVIGIENNDDFNSTLLNATMNEQQQQNTNGIIVTNENKDISVDVLREFELEANITMQNSNLTNTDPLDMDQQGCIILVDGMYRCTD